MKEYLNVISAIKTELRILPKSLSRISKLISIICALSIFEFFFLFVLSSFLKGGSRVLGHSTTLLLFLLIAVSLSRYLLFFLQQSAMLNIADEVKTNITVREIKELNQLTPGKLSELPVGNFLHAMIHSITTLFIGSLISLFTIIADLFALTFLAAFMLWQLGVSNFLVIFFLMGVIQIINLTFVAPRLSANNRANQSANRNLYNFFSEYYQSFREIKLFNLENYFLKDLNASINIENRTIKKRYFLQEIPRMNFELGFVFFLIFLSNIHVHSTTGLGVSGFTLIAYGIMRLIPILSRINGSLNGLLAGNESTSSLTSMHRGFAFDESMNSNFDLVLQGSQIYTLDLTSIHKEVKGRKLLLPSELHLERGSVLGVVGPSGVGKTTLLNILSGLEVPDSCSLKINNIDSPLFALKNHVSLVTQTPIFFRGTIRENLITTSPDMVLDLQRAKYLITYLGLSEDPELFLETRLDNNSGLSGGELQRLALVRAFLSNREVLLLDEATSAQDDGNEKRIMELLNEDAGNRITVVVSHRASFLGICNTLIEIEVNRLSK